MQKNVKKLLIIFMLKIWFWKYFPRFSTQKVPQTHCQINLRLISFSSPGKSKKGPYPALGKIGANWGTNLIASPLSIHHKQVWKDKAHYCSFSTDIVEDQSQIVDKERDFIYIYTPKKRLFYIKTIHNILD